MKNSKSSSNTSSIKSSSKALGKRRSLLALLHKEFFLSASPLSILFLAFSALTLVPNYPILTGAMLVCLGIFYSIYRCQANGDFLFTVMLPVPKTDAVRSKYLFSCTIQLIAWVLAAVCTVIRIFTLDALPAYQEPFLMPANLAYLAYTVLIYAAFNFLFLRAYFVGMYQTKAPFASFLVVSALIVAAAEGLQRLGVLPFLRSTLRQALLPQAAMLCAALAIYILLTVSSYRSAVRAFLPRDI